MSHTARPIWLAGCLAALLVAGCQPDATATPTPATSPHPTNTPTKPPTPPPSVTPTTGPATPTPYTPPPITPIIIAWGELIIHAQPGLEYFLIYTQTIPDGVTWYKRQYIMQPDSGVYAGVALPGVYLIAPLYRTEHYTATVTPGDTTLFTIPPPPPSR